MYATVHTPNGSDAGQAVFAGVRTMGVRRGRLCLDGRDTFRRWPSGPYFTLPAIAGRRVS